jgi:hypothetical protein
MIDLKSLNKKDIAVLIALALVVLGAVIADIILVVKLLQEWQTLIAAIVLSGAAVGGVFGVIAYLKKAAAVQS